MFFLSLYLFICDASFRRQNNVFKTACSKFDGLRFCTSIPDGFRLIDIPMKGLAPWANTKQSRTEDQKPIDISKFCIDHERGLLYRYQSWQEMEKEQDENSHYSKQR